MESRREMAEAGEAEFFFFLVVVVVFVATVASWG